MKAVTALVFVSGLIAAGCTQITPSISAEKKAELREILDPKFSATSGSTEKEEEFYAVLDAFAHRRKSSELVRSVRFISHGEAVLTYSDGFQYVVAFLKKKSGGWRIVREVVPAVDPIQIYPLLPESPQKSEPNQSLQPTAPSRRG